MPQLASGHGPEAPRYLNRDAGRLLEATAFHQANGGICDRFCSQPMNRSGLQPEYVARQMKRADLASAVVQQLVGTNRAANHLVDVFGGLAFAVNFLILAV